VAGWNDVADAEEDDDVTRTKPKFKARSEDQYL
jgi:hypothetical protein